MAKSKQPPYVNLCWILATVKLNKREIFCATFFWICKLLNSETMKALTFLLAQWALHSSYVISSNSAVLFQGLFAFLVLIITVFM